MKRAVLFVVAAMASAAGASAAEPKRCQLVTVAEWPLRANYYTPVIDGAINGHKIGIMLDTGASSSSIERAAVARLKLETSPLSGYRAFGIGGETRVEAAYIAELKIGAAVRKGWRAFVVGETAMIGDVALLLGDDFFSQLDVEFDLGNNVVRLFQPKQCDGVSLGYWAKGVMAVRLESLEKIHVAVSVNGQSMLAMLDSGAPLSKLSLEAARQLGVTPRTAGVSAGGCVSGLGRERYESWIAPFSSFSIGDEVIRDPKLRFAPIWQHVGKDETGTHLRRRLDGLPDMLLGADFLRSHRVFISHSQRKMYFSYTGGTVFPATPGKPCRGEKS
jgi:predicted aspartyl protease